MEVFGSTICSKIVSCFTSLPTPGKYTQLFSAQMAPDFTLAELMRVVVGFEPGIGEQEQNSGRLLHSRKDGEQGSESVMMVNGWLLTIFSGVSATGDLNNMRRYRIAVMFLPSHLMIDG